MIKIRFIFTILLMVNLASCQKGENQNKVKGSEISKSELNLEGHTFFKIIETDSGRVLFKPCGALIEKYKFYKDSIYHNWGQEYDFIKKTSLKKNKDIYIFEGHNHNTNKTDVIQIKKMNSEGSYLKINDKIFIDSLFTKTIVLAKEPCSEDVEEPYDISEENINFEKDIVSTKTWSNDCELDEAYVYFSAVGGQFVFRQKFGMNTKIIKISNNEFNVLFDNSYIKRPYPKDMENYQDYSATEPIAKMKKNGNKIEFVWYGFYDTKTKKKVRTENPFTNKMENAPIILKKCD